MHANTREIEEKKKVSACVCMEERSHRVGQEVLTAGSAHFLPVPSIALDAKRTHIHTQKKRSTFGFEFSCEKKKSHFGQQNKKIKVIQWDPVGEVDEVPGNEENPSGGGLSGVESDKEGGKSGGSF